MGKIKKIRCRQCDGEVAKDAASLNKKLVSKSVTRYFCLECLADYLEVSTENLIEKIEEFKAEGCTLF